MSKLIEIDYEFDSVTDEYGDFPIRCATMLFDLLGFNKNVIIKNQYVYKPEKAFVVARYYGKDSNRYYEWPKNRSGDYCVWIKEGYSSNQELIDFLSLQVIHLSFIVPTKTFDWEKFIENWRSDEQNLIQTGQASFICNIVDMDRDLNLFFNADDYTPEMISDMLARWESEITKQDEPIKVQRSEYLIRGKYGEKSLITIHIMRK